MMNKETKRKDMNAIQKRLKYLKKQIENEQISMSEIMELQSLADHIDGDVVLLEWSGKPEFA